MRSGAPRVRTRVRPPGPRDPATRGGFHRAAAGDAALRHRTAAARRGRSRSPHGQSGPPAGGSRPGRSVCAARCAARRSGLTARFVHVGF
ncbi:MAG: hypothetical protein B7Z15_21485 [Rhizobiales bacterium 32-66-8]|nr:MAG: hypothetical protein B7Z15_21485 [Rhizobiales bacterium 32-66-8]